MVPVCRKHPVIFAQSQGASDLCCFLAFKAGICPDPALALQIDDFPIKCPHAYELAVTCPREIFIDLISISIIGHFPVLVHDPDDRERALHILYHVITLSSYVTRGYAILAGVSGYRSYCGSVVL